MKKIFGYDKKQTFSNVMKHRDEIKQFLGESLQYTNILFILYYVRDIKLFFILNNKWLRL